MTQNNLDRRWDLRNRMTAARDRHRDPTNLAHEVRDRMAGADVLRDLRDSKTSVGDVRILSTGGNVIPITRRMVNPISPSMVSPLVRRMGDTTITQRARLGNDSLWSGTPVEEERPSLGDPVLLQDAEDLTGLLSDWDRVGWFWSKKENALTAFLTLGTQTYMVKLPLAKIQAIFNRRLRAHSGSSADEFKEKSLDGFFKKLGNGLKKAVKGIVKNTVKSITAPIRFVKNPKKFIKDTAAHIKKTVKGVGKTVLKVASSPIFAGVMTAIAAIPPLTVVGAAGLAAFAAANAIKPAFKALEKGIDVVDAVTKKKRANIKAGIGALPPQAKRMMNAALKSTPDTSMLPKAGFRLAGGALQKLF